MENKVKLAETVLEGVIGSIAAYGYLLLLLCRSIKRLILIIEEGVLAIQLRLFLFIYILHKE